MRTMQERNEGIPIVVVLIITMAFLSIYIGMLVSYRNQFRQYIGPATREEEIRE